jgi:hypothetical protein
VLPTKWMPCDRQLHSSNAACALSGGRGCSNQHTAAGINGLSTFNRGTASWYRGNFGRQQIENQPLGSNVESARLTRHHDPRDDAPAERQRQQYRGPPVTLGHIRSHGVRHLLIYCSAGPSCHHSAVVDADRWPDETVLPDLDGRAVCTKCGMIGADVRPNWTERPQPGTPTGLPWRRP